MTPYLDHRVRALALTRGDRASLDHQAHRLAVFADFESATQRVDVQRLENGVVAS